MEDQVGAVLPLRQEEPLVDRGIPACSGGEERGQHGKPSLAAARQVVGGERLGERLQAGGVTAGEKRIPALADAAAFSGHPRRQPVMLIQAQARGEGEVGTQAHEHPAPVGIDQIEAVLVDPTPLGRQMPPIGFADGGQAAGGVAGLEAHHDLGRLRAAAIGGDAGVAAAGRRIANGGTPRLGASLHPAVVLCGDVAQDGAGHRIELAIGGEEADDAFGLLQRLDETIEQDPIETPLPAPDAIVVVLVEGVRGTSRAWDNPDAYPWDAATSGSEISRALPFTNVPS